MKEELHHLLDGEMSDGETAELLRSLAGDGENRSLFRQQMKLQRELSRNGCNDSMTANEEAEMLGRLRDAIGVTEKPASLGRIGRGALALVAAAGLIIGGGIGYIAHNSDAMPPERRDTAPAVYQPPAAAPAAAAIDHDSLVTFIRDSLAQAMAKPASSAAPKKRVEHSSRRAAPSFDDPTGAAAARRLAKKSRAR